MSAPPHLADVWVETAGGISAVCGDMTRVADDLGAGLVGYGLAGQLLAASLSARTGADGAFLRVREKGHGTGRRLDGALAPSALRAVICPRGEERRCRSALAAVGSASLPLVAFELRAAEPSGFAEFVGTDVPSRPAAAALRAEAVLLRGTFTLSSGATAERYWETLPAAHRYRVALAVARRSPGAAFVGVGHGGAYLAAVAAMARGRQPLVVDPAVPCTPTRDEAPLLVDDFVTSGTSFARALEAFTPQARLKARRVALYALRERIGAVRFVEVLEQLA